MEKPAMVTMTSKATRGRRWKCSLFVVLVLIFQRKYHPIQHTIDATSFVETSCSCTNHCTVFALCFTVDVFIPCKICIAVVCVAQSTGLSGSRYYCIRQKYCMKIWFHIFCLCVCVLNSNTPIGCQTKKQEQIFHKWKS